MNIFNNKALVRFLIVLIIVFAGLIILEMWFDLFPKILFAKILITIAIVGGVISVIMAVKEDFSGNQKLKKDKFVD